MSAPTAFHQLGKFIVYFQHAEDAINEILLLLANADDEVVRILVNELGYVQRLKTVEALLARIVDLQREPDVSAKADFHKLVGDLEALGRRRNDFVHSKYMQWRNVEGSLGLIRQNSKLRKGIREEQEEELQPEAFNADIDNIECVLRKLEAFRLRILDWLYPDVVPVKP